MGSGSDESIYWMLTMVTTITYHNYKIAITITHNQLTFSTLKSKLNYTLGIQIELAQRDIDTEFPISHWIHMS
jgi:hypothetical protein